MVHRDCIDTKSLFGCAMSADPPIRIDCALLSRFRAWRERARSRHLLLQLDDRMLRDVGLTRSDVDRECAKYFWQS